MHSGSDRSDRSEVGGSVEEDGAPLRSDVAWAMQFAVLVPRAAAPAASDAAEAAATAGALLLADERAAAGGSWHDAVQRWLDGHIRKLVRRGRGAAWERAVREDGVTVTVGTATVRAFVPCPVDAVPDAVAKLQLSGADLDDPPGGGAPASWQPPPGWPGLLVAVSPHVTLSAWKAAAQVAHGGTLAWLRMPPAVRDRWAAAGCPVRVVRPGPGGWAAFTAVADVAVHDGGLTEVAPGTHTTSACWGPW